MKQTFDMLNKMHADGVIGPYAIAGAVAAYRYLEPAVTEDLDILVAFQSKSGLIDLAPVLVYLKAAGYESPHKEGIVIGDWPVQFIPVTDDLDAEALANANDIEIEMVPEGSVRTRILRPEYLVAIALRVGRPKDQLRITQFIDERILEFGKLCDILRRHGLIGRWQSLCQRAGIPDPCELK